MGNQSSKPHTIFRSSEMSLYEIIFRYETAYECINVLGESGLVQFEDLNEGCVASQRKYASEIQRCGEIERKLRYVESEMKKANIKVSDILEIPKTPHQKEIGAIELILQKTASDLKEEIDSIAGIKKGLNESKEMKYVLERVQTFFDDGDPELAYVDFISEFDKRPGFLPEYGIFLQSGTEDENTEQHATVKFREDDHGDSGRMKVAFLAGTVTRTKIPSMERMLWRVSRGNSFFRFYEISEKLIDPFTGEPTSKSVFIIFFVGEKLKSRVTKICEGFRAVIYPCPLSFDERRLVTLQAYIEIHDMEAVIVKATLERDRILRLAAGHDLAWAIKVRKMKSIYHTMNMLSYDTTKTSLVGKCWIPTAEVLAVRSALAEGVQRSGCAVSVLMNQLPTSVDPPTYNKTNKFTKGFQALVDAYGVASYRELNPAPYYMITFPFLFGVMFGDIGHGLIVFIFGLVLILQEKTFMKTRSGNEIWKIFFGGRYIIMMMGLFSIYCGIIYNDIFSKSFNFFGSKWSGISAYNPLTKGVLARSFAPLDVFVLNPFKPSPNTTNGYAFANEPYWYGLDPIWSSSAVKINFLNSFKMKTSIIFGFVQMFAGILLSLGNFVYFKKQLNIWCEFLPQILFLACMFGYLVFLIFYKWVAYGPFDEFPHEKSHACAPMLLIRFIDMLMLADSVPITGCPLEMFANQQIVQKVLMIIIVITIPWMLLTRPLILAWRQRKKHHQQRFMPNEQTSRASDRTDENSETQLPAQEHYENVERTASGPEEYSNNGHEGDGDDGDDSEDDNDSGVPDNAHSDYAMTVNPAIFIPFEEEDEDEFEGNGELFIHQGIHTIEFVLGSISHTASYLRLWALSLAHEQLSEVLYSMVIAHVLPVIGESVEAATHPHLWAALLILALMLFCVFATWATLTFAILVLMEGLSAFLHTLRLHWVEFQSKFYSGLGHPFYPFSFPVIISVLEEERQAVE